MARFSWPRSSVIAATAAVGCVENADKFLNPDFCQIAVASIVPPAPMLNIGDTVTLRAQFGRVADECLPLDTTAKSLRWVTDALGVITIDSLTAHVTALKTGGVSVLVRGKYKGGYAGVGFTLVSVLEPSTADTVMSHMSNQAPDSASITLEDANGIVHRTQTVAGHGSTCWVTPLSDSVRYSAFVHSPSGPTAPGGIWVSHRALIQTHTWYVTVGVTGTAPALTAIVHVMGSNGDTGC